MRNILFDHVSSIARSVATKIYDQESGGGEHCQWELTLCGTPICLTDYQRNSRVGLKSSLCISSFAPREGKGPQDKDTQIAHIEGMAVDTPNRLRTLPEERRIHK